MKKEVAVPNFIEMEHDTLAFWKEHKCFDKLVEKNKNSKTRFRFLDGPMTANNPAGVHHIWGRTLKDMNIKYHSLKGESCQYQNGFDAQGLWVEVEVEKALGLNGKPEIVKYGLDKFTRTCMDRVNHFAGIITDQSIRMGQWMDWENSYFTNTDHNITSIWHFLKECDKRGWLVRKNRPMVWCPRCGTSLSDHEMSGSYSDVTHTAIFVKLPVKDRDFSMIAWTTTPWTLSANVALAVNPNLDYVKVNFHGENIVLGKDSLKVLKEKVEILDTFKGSDLVGLEYETCFPELPFQNFSHKVVAWEDVDASEGSCVVHIAPGCGVEDFELGQKLGLPAICPINDNGIMLDECGFLAGRKTTDVVDMVVDRLKSDNKLLYAHPYKHSYPHCWRCKTDVVYKLVSSWYIKVDELRPMLLDAIEDVTFQPEYAKKRMQDWILNMGDWPISRSRFYGLPLPFYVCPKCNKVHVIGSLEELKERAVEPDLVDSIPNLHRPWIDDIHIKCDCGETLTRVTEVGDCWLDSGITPFSTKKYFTDREYFNDNFPSDYVCEMIEQVRLWFFSCLVMSVVLTGKAPYKRVVTHQYVKDENGNEFHKSGGNSLQAHIVADKVGADTIRYLYGGANPTMDVRFGYNLADEARRKLLGFWNTYTFFNTYASIDNPDIANYKLNTDNLTKADKWLIESVNKFIANSDKNYSEYKSYLVVKDFETLVDDISNFYIRGNRKRFWKSENADDQMTAYWCLYNAIKNICIVMAPITPFMTEHIWQNMVREIESDASESIMLSSFPTCMLDVKFDNVIADTDNAREVIAIAQRLRNENQIKIKQPLKTMFLNVNDESVRACREFESMIKEELNIKEIVFESDNNKFNIPYLTIDFKKAGAVLKGDVQKVKALLTNADESTMADLVAQHSAGKVTVGEFSDLDSSLFVLAYKPKSEYVVATENGKTVVLDTTIDLELTLEGMYREFVRGLQVMRKESDFRIEDRIVAQFTTTSDLAQKMLDTFIDKIKAEALIKSVEEVSNPLAERDIETQDETIHVRLTK
ncbi:MAG: isoleucine--tRNA ligase [Clostridia bacterium]|nr:isoleucine--tRNA ligase [Clostridia bacterium]